MISSKYSQETRYQTNQLYNSARNREVLKESIVSLTLLALVLKESIVFLTLPALVAVDDAA